MNDFFHLLIDSPVRILASSEEGAIGDRDEEFEMFGRPDPAETEDRPVGPVLPLLLEGVIKR